MNQRLIFAKCSKPSGCNDITLSEQLRDSLCLRTEVELHNCQQLDSYFGVSFLAASSVAAVGSAIADLLIGTGLSENSPRVQVDQRLASLWFHQSIYPIGWALPPAWDSLAGDYRTRDGWIKLHTNLARHRQAAIRVLGVSGNRDQVTKEILNWDSNELERAIVGDGGVAARMRSRQEWQDHPQGIAIASEPVIGWGKARPGALRFSPSSRQCPLKGLRVLDLTRVLAGPVATRTLACLGADVLRIDPPGWDEPFVVPDISVGKRCAYLDLNRKEDRQAFEGLLKSADVLVHGYRPGALDDLGYGRLERQRLSAELIEVSLDAYGWTGPWAQRRGFDSLVQMSTGIAHRGMRWTGAETPTPLPVQALDHATGYLMAAAAICLVRKALNGEGVGRAQLSLARTSELLATHLQAGSARLNRVATLADFSGAIEPTPWGEANRLKQALAIEGTRLAWASPASNLGTSPACWKA